MNYLEQIKSLSANKKYWIAFIIAFNFHFFGCIGMYNEVPFFINSTSLNLYICLALIIFTHQPISNKFWVFCIVSILFGLFVEMIGVNTALLFGNYKYGTVLGIKIVGVPLTIGFNWFVVLYCCCTTIFYFLNKLILNFGKKQWHTFLFAMCCASLAVLFDFIIEPIAIRFQFWQWLPNQEIPIYNYISWWICSLPISILFLKLHLFSHNRFAYILLVLQTVFFLILQITR